MNNETNISRRLTALETGFKRHDQLMAKHITADAKVFKVHSELLKQVATKKDLETLSASVNDVAELIKNFRIGVHVGGKIFGFSGKAILYVGGVCTSLAAIYLAFKWFLVKLF